MNFVDIVLILLIGAAFIMAVAVCVRSRRQGKGCCGDCSRCSGCGDITSWQKR